MLGRLLLQRMNCHHHADFGWVIFFLVAGRILCFGSMMEIMLITQDYRTADWVSLERTYKLMFELLLSSLYKSRIFSFSHHFISEEAGDAQEAVIMTQRWRYDPNRPEGYDIMLSIVIRRKVGQGNSSGTTSWASMSGEQLYCA